MLTHSAALAAVPQEHKAALEAEGIDVSNLVQILIQHGCDVAPALRLIIPLLPLSPAIKVAILGVLSTVCPVG